MSRRISRDDLHRRAGQRAAATETRRDASAGRPPVPGDVFLVREAGEHPVHWLILASDPSAKVTVAKPSEPVFTPPPSGSSVGCVMGTHCSVPRGSIDTSPSGTSTTSL